MSFKMNAIQRNDINVIPIKKQRFRTRTGHYTDRYNIRSFDNRKYLSSAEK